ncbi:hypothetical protein [Novosphingobium sp. BL-52-GroH]|uniref:hypothetical protein n=1 Tax=Novosphingobium sp. BL-52-GroH TaxID=3349877 RepID=UPI003850EA7D
MSHGRAAGKNHNSFYVRSDGQARLTARICRPSEFYGFGKPQSISNGAIIEPLAKGKSARVFLRDETLPTPIYTPGTSRAMALQGYAPEPYGRSFFLMTKTG